MLLLLKKRNNFDSFGKHESQQIFFLKKKDPSDLFDMFLAKVNHRGYHWSDPKGSDFNHGQQ